MVVFPNCKINLGLNILNKRADGFHNLETVFYSIMIKDALEVIKSSVISHQSIVNSHQSLVNSHQSLVDFTTTGLSINGDEQNNLCIKAYHLLKKDFPDLPTIQMHLHKAIPIGAGLGGGSADGAFALKLLNEKFKLQLSLDQLKNYALQLGSDCPFFIINKPCFATSRGEVLEEINLDLSAFNFVMVNPNIHINTGWAFYNITPALPKKSIKEIIQQPINTWKNELLNDFEKPVFEQYPEIKNIKENLYEQGALYASMSGTGSTVFGIFEKQVSIKNNFQESYFIANV